LILQVSSSHEEGGERHWQVLTKRFEGQDGHVSKLSCVKVEFSPSDGKVCPVMREVPHSEFEIEADLVILAVGFLYPERTGLLEGFGVRLDARGNVSCADNYTTSVKKVFSAGDMRRGQSLVVWAISEGRRCAHFMDRYLTGQSNLPVI
jgi:glutamate synthase (NADPH/NADH) small chain